LTRKGRRESYSGRIGGMASFRGGQIEVDSDDDRAGEAGEGEEEEEEEEEGEESLLEMRKPEAWMLEHGHFSDVTVTCQNQSYHLHKFVLCRESLRFQEMLMDPASENDRIQVDYDDDDFELFVHLLYTGENLSGDFDADLVWRWCCKGGLRRDGIQKDEEVGSQSN